MHAINHLLVANNGKKLRLILDLKYINKHLWVQKFKYEDSNDISKPYQQK